jgi:hypothetical protein
MLEYSDNALIVGRKLNGGVATINSNSNVEFHLVVQFVQLSNIIVISWQ